MFKVVKKEIEVAGKKISLETGKIARQADGAIIASCGETVVLATVVGAARSFNSASIIPFEVSIIAIKSSAKIFFGKSAAAIIKVARRSRNFFAIIFKFSKMI